MRGLGFAIVCLACAAAGPARAAEDPPLIAAAKAGDVATVNTLLKAGVAADTPDESKCTALNWAAYDGYRNVAEALISAGAKIDQRCDRASWTPLMNAAAMGHLEVAALLLDKGADINARSTDGGYTPLMYAARKKMRYVVTLLLDRGARINDAADDKRTALDLAEDAGIIAELTAHGAHAGNKP